MGTVIYDGSDECRPNDYVSSRTVLVTGGTGSFGRTVTGELLATNVAEIRILSRDEEKQDAMRHQFADPRLRFNIGDVRDMSSIEHAVEGADFVFHAAALKQVPSCEFFPVEAVRTNMIGSSNVIEASHRAGVSAVVCLSTDKAVRPVNAMGMSKALMEKTAQAFARNHPTSRTRVCVTRYGNVMHSRGSVIPLFIEQIRRREPVTVTDPQMTRFMMTLPESVDLVRYAFARGESGELLIRKAPACTISTLVEALAELYRYQPEVQIIGVRHGEKVHETLATSEELSRAIDEGDYFRIALDARGLDYSPYFEEGEPGLEKIQDYSSDTTEQLGVEEMIEMLLRLPEIVADINGDESEGGR